MVYLAGVFYFEEEEEGPIEEVVTKEMSIMHWEGVVRQQVTLTIDSFWHHKDLKAVLPSPSRCRLYNK